MYENILKMAQENMKPFMQLAESNTALAVRLMKSQTEQTSELLTANLAHLQALAETKDLNAAVQMQQKFAESLGEKVMETAKQNTAEIESVLGEAGKVFEGSLVEVQNQAKKTVESIEKEIKKATNKAA